jgi:uncharacterized protein YpmS
VVVGKTPETRKKSRRRKLLWWLAIDFAVAAVILALLVYKPSRYNPVIAPVPADPNGQVVHPYLHRDLGSKFYNDAQRQRPFEMVVLDKSLNEAIASMSWPRQSEGITLSRPEVLFVPGRIILMGTADIEGARFVVTVELAPQLDEAGSLNLLVEKVKVGAMNITPLAKMVARKMFQERLAQGWVDTEHLGTKIVASLLAQEAFDPVMDVDGRKVRLRSVDVTQGKLTAQFVPAK